MGGDVLALFPRLRGGAGAFLIAAPLVLLQSKAAAQ